MHDGLKDIPERILDVAIGALTQANQHAVYYDPGMDHWTDMSILNAAMAGELFIKAVVARQHPLLIFRDLFSLDDPRSEELSIEHIIKKGRTYNFDELPKLLWVTTGERLPDAENYEQLRRARNAIQHFCSPGQGIELRALALRFLYKNIDPLIYKNFGICAIEYHEDQSIGYDYVVSQVIRHELLFSIPKKFEITEINLREEVGNTGVDYQKELEHHFSASGHSLEDAMKYNSNYT